MRETANVIELRITFDRARALVWAESIAGHARKAVLADFAEHIPNKAVTVEIARIYDEEDE